MWGACVGVYQLLNWKMHGETLKKVQLNIQRRANTEKY